MSRSEWDGTGSDTSVAAASTISKALRTFTEPCAGGVRVGLRVAVRSTEAFLAPNTIVSADGLLWPFLRVRPIESAKHRSRDACCWDFFSDVQVGVCTVFQKMVPCIHSTGMLAKRFHRSARASSSHRGLQELL